MFFKQVLGLQHFFGCRLHYNLGAGAPDAKGTSRDYLTHLNAIPGEIRAVCQGYFNNG